MKIIFTTVCFILNAVVCRSQVNDSVQITGIRTKASITLDNVTNLSGGIQRGTALLALFSISLDYSPKARILKNTGFHLHLIKTAGKGASENFIGDLQVASNIEGRYSLFFYEMLVRQRIGHFTATVGMHDLNSEFMVSDYAGDFINSSFGILPSVSLNVPVSIFPSTTFGGLISYSKEKLDVLAGIYNLNYEFCEEETFHFNNHFYQRGYLGVGEVHYRYFRHDRQVAECRIGAYLKKCYDYNDENMPGESVGDINTGLYFIGDVALVEFSEGNMLGAFVQAGWSPLEKNLASQYLGAGISYRCESGKFTPEQLGLALGRVKLNEFQGDRFEDMNQSETVIEATATVPLFKLLKIQPDIQYIISPSGIYDNSITAIVRIKADLM
jgi:porin